jgi:hypothetical protein
MEIEITKGPLKKIDIQHEEITENKIVEIKDINDIFKLLKGENIILIYTKRNHEGLKTQIGIDIFD